MNSTAIPGSDSIDARENILRGLLSDHQADKFTLPHFTLEKSGFEKIWDAVLEWIKARLSIKPINLPFNGPTILMILKIVLAVMALALIVAVAVQLVAYFKTKRKNLPAACRLKNDSPYQTEYAYFKTQIDTALAQSEFALAARLRWKWFLARKALGASITPFEYFAQPDRAASISVTLIYQLMFAKPAPKTDYEALDQSLAGLEN